MADVRGGEPPEQQTRPTMRRPHIEILLTPSRLEVASRRAGVAMHLDPALWQASWREGLAPIAQPLRDALNQLGMDRGEARVHYVSPTLAAHTSTIRGAGPAACRAATRALRDATSLDVKVNPSGLHEMHAWTGKRSRSLWGMAAECDSSARTIVQWLSEQGVSTLSLCPLDLALDRAVVHSLTAHHRSGPVVVLHLGEHVSRLACGMGRQVHFVQPVSLTLECLTEALTQPLRTSGGDEPSTTLDALAARMLLFRTGVPLPTEMVDEQQFLRGDAVIHALRGPVQQFLIEGKHAISDALSEKRRGEGHLLVTGPGADIPRLQETLAGQLGLEELLLLEDPEDRYDPFVDVSPVGDLDIARRFAPPGVNLLPVSTRVERRRRHSRNLVAVGAALALLAGGAQFISTWMSSASLRTQLDALNMRAAALEAIRVEHNTTNERANAVRSVQRDIRELTSGQPAWDALLTEVMLRTPANVRLSSLDGTAPSGTDVAELHISGLLFDQTPGTRQEATTLASWMSDLESSPLIDHVSLRATHRTTVEGRAARHIELRLRAASHRPAVARTEGPPA